MLRLPSPIDESPGDLSPHLSRSQAVGCSRWRVPVTVDAADCVRADVGADRLSLFVRTSVDVLRGPLPGLAIGSIVLFCVAGIALDRGSSWDRSTLNLRIRPYTDGDRASLNLGCTIRPHLFEGRIVKADSVTKRQGGFACRKSSVGNTNPGNRAGSLSPGGLKTGAATKAAADHQWVGEADGGGYLSPLTAECRDHH